MPEKKESPKPISSRRRNPVLFPKSVIDNRAEVQDDGRQKPNKPRNPQKLDVTILSVKGTDLDGHKKEQFSNQFKLKSNLLTKITEPFRTNPELKYVTQTSHHLGAPIVREFFNLDREDMQNKNQLMQQWGSSKETSQLRLLEPDTDYVAYDRKGRILAAYFFNAHVRAHGEEIGTDVIKFTTRNIRVVSGWNKLKWDSSIRHGESEKVGVFER